MCLSFLANQRPVLGLKSAAPVVHGGCIGNVLGIYWDGEKSNGNYF